MEYQERLASLEARVEAIERRGTVPVASESPFWVTEGLVERGLDGVVFSGVVELPVGGAIRWQYGLATPIVLGQVWDEAAPALAALGSAVRLRLLHAVLEGHGRTAELAEIPDVGSTGSLYHHLRELVAGGWLVPAGKAAHRIPGERIVPLMVILAASGALRVEEAQ